jgi:hypothetical protein
MAAVPAILPPEEAGTFRERRSREGRKNGGEESVRAAATGLIMKK